MNSSQGRARDSQPCQLSLAAAPAATTRFSRSEDVASSTAIKSSHQRGIRTKLVEQMPLLGQPSSIPGAEDGTAPEGSEQPTLLEVIWPKKEGLTLVKWCVHAAQPASTAIMELQRLKDNACAGAYLSGALARSLQP